MASVFAAVFFSHVPMRIYLCPYLYCSFPTRSVCLTARVCAGVGSLELEATHKYACALVLVCAAMYALTCFRSVMHTLVIGSLCKRQHRTACALHLHCADEIVSL